MKNSMIIKRSGEKEKYRIEKIEKSMLAAGITAVLSKEVAKEIEFHDEITTREVRGHVIGKIKNKDPQAAKRYESHPRKTQKS